MATYAIGDIQGCFHSFQSLLSEIDFRPSQDTLWLVGDMVNRGAGSLEMLRWAYAHQSSVVAVLGNHDLHTLVVAEGFVRAHRGDTITPILEDEDRDNLLNWLRQQPLMHSEQGYTMVHAGLLPQWTLSQALSLAAEAQQALRSDHYREYLQAMYGNHPAAWDDSLQGMDRFRCIVNAMTRLRVCDKRGEMEFKFKGALRDIAVPYMPWFDVPNRATREDTLIFGHWSALGLQQRPHLFALDTGCLWGGQLTALRLDDRQIFQVPCALEDGPKPIEE